MNVIIMGDGAFGSAIMSLFSENNVKATYWRGEKLAQGATVIGAIPTQFIRETLEKSKGVQKITYINCAKGIEKETHKLPYQVVSEILEKPDYFTLMGPSFAQEIKEKMPTLVNLGYRNVEHAEAIKKLFQTDYVRVKLTAGIRSVELSAAFKNIYAISCGVAAGLGYGMNTRVKLMCLAMDEFNNLRIKLGYKIDEQAIPGTIGDLILTCSSEESRNFSFGELLATDSAKDALEKISGTVEGYYTVESVPYFEKTTGVSLPLARFVYDLTDAKNLENIKRKFTAFVKTT